MAHQGIAGSGAAPFSGQGASGHPVGVPQLMAWDGWSQEEVLGAGSDPTEGGAGMTPSPLCQQLQKQRGELVLPFLGGNKPRAG